MRTFCAVSTFNAAGLELYGRRMVSSFREHWPEEVGLRVYSEGWGLLDCWGPEIVHLASASPWLNEFKARHGHRTFRDFRWDAVRFSHKVAAVCHAARTIDVDVLIWLDGDIVTHASLTIEDLEGLAPRDGEWISWLYRQDMYPECGFYMLDRRHPEHDRLIASLEAMYMQDLLYGLAEYHDSYVLRHVVEAARVPWRSISGKGGTTSHPLINGPLGQWFDHLKGNRKREGRSRPADLKVARSEGYWK
ncbi:hypothetical protein [Sinorhizobium americanum]|uniref:Galactosyl transferase GMA12/MNN10 family protein n=1 Tax=Sinorhizobium americanum TaxID=194963 RepID=A0A4R2BRH3_9HYPH|nr:hypothetical protein [Sinorhizobium americanum]TCN30337.1 hypothetical protein EV184_108211 [Sinorhizobium americanum]